MKKTYFLLLLLAAILCPAITRASHAQGADLSYKFISYDPIGGSTQYVVTATFYRDCAGIAQTGAMLLNVTNSFCGGSYTTQYSLPLINGLACPFGGVSGVTGCEVSHLCSNALALSTCTSGTYPGMQKYVYSDTITLPGNTVPLNHCSQWTISIDITARNPSTNLVNSASDDLYIEAVINNAIDPQTLAPYQNSSPVFQNDPVPFVCLNASAALTYNNATIEPDGDSLVYSLTTPLGGHNAPIVFNTGYTVTCPIRSTIACAFDSATGIFTYAPAQTEIDVMAYLVQEYRHGVLVGSTMRDVQINILNCAESVPVLDAPAVVQGGVLADSALVTGCPGDDLIIDMPASSTNGSNLTLQSTIGEFPGSYPGMTFTQVGSGATLAGRIEWASIDTVCRYVYVKAISDDCPVASTVYRVIQICGNRRVGISPASPVYCGRPVTLTASGGTNPVWTPAAGLSSVNTLSTQASPTTSTWYHYSSTCVNDSVYVRVSSAIAISITHDTSACNGYPLQLQETTSRPVTSTYKWTPAVGLYDPITGLPSDSISDPVFKNNTSTVYHCITTDTSGCVLDDSVRVTVHGPGVLMLTADTLVALGAQAHLSATIAPFTPVCATVPDTTVTQLSHVLVGTDTLIQGGTAFGYPSPFGNYYKSARHQMLFHASELNALFGGSRIITSISLNIGTLNSNAGLDNFTIKMAGVHVDSLTQYAGTSSSLLTVYEDSVYVPVSGWNVFTFQNAYVWDGVSDVVVDMCFYSPVNNNINNMMRYTLTPFRSLLWSASNGYSMCGVTGTQPQSPLYANFFHRPNVQFGLGVVSGGLSSFSWQQPVSGLNAINDVTSTSTYATVSSDQWYTAILQDATCPQTDSILVRVIGHATHTPQHATICAGDSVLLTAQGASSYSWSDNSGVLSTSSSFYYAPAHSSSVILVMTDTAGIHTDTSRITVLDQKVWPGDANDDDVVDNTDILSIGIAFGDTGAVRPAASLSWSQQCAAGWDSTIAGGANAVHADCDGDGIVRYSDTLAVLANWGLTHAKTSYERQSNYYVTITTDKPAYNTFDTIRATLSIGDNATPIPNIYGVAYQFGYSSVGTAHIVGIDQSMSWLDRKLDFGKIAAPVNAYMAQSRINHRDTAGYGKIAEVRLVVDHAISQSDSAYLTVSNILAVDRKGDTVVINAASKTVTVGTALGVTVVGDVRAIDIYPNPNSGSFRLIQTGIDKVNMTMMDAIGREVYSKTLTERVTNIDVSTLPDGVYIASFSSIAGRSSKRVIITR